MRYIGKCTSPIVNEGAKKKNEIPWFSFLVGILTSWQITNLQGIAQFSKFKIKNCNFKICVRYFLEKHCAVRVSKF